MKVEIVIPSCAYCLKLATACECGKPTRPNG